MIDITITACLRPTLLLKTFESFFENFNGFSGVKKRLIINFDRVGIYGSEEECIKICRVFFQDITFNLPEIPSFSRAFKWVWEQTTSPYILHLEDDWEMIRKVDLEAVITLLEKYEDLMILRLPAFRSTKEHMKNWNKFYPWNGEFFECPENEKGGLAFCGHPSLIKKKFVHYVAPRLDPTRNPEKQIKGRNPAFKDFLEKYRYGVFARQDDPPAIRDIGRHWMIKNGFKKKGSKAFFTEWEKC